MYKKWLKRILSALAIFAIAALAVAMMLFLLLQTGMGKGFLQDTLNRRLVWEGGQVVIEGFSGIVPFDFMIRQVTVHDREGEWLEAENVELHWSPVKLLLKRSVKIFAAGAQVLDIKRLPEVEAEDEKEPFKLPESIGWHWPLPAVQVENFFLREIRVPASIAGENADFGLQTAWRVDGEGFSLPFFKLNRLDRPGTELQLEAAWRQPDASLSLLVRLQDRRTLPALTGIDEWPETVYLNLSGQGPCPRWQGALRIYGVDFFDIDFDVAVAGLNNGSQLLLDGKMNLEKTDWLPEIWREYVEKAYYAQLSLEMFPAEQQVSSVLRLQSDFFQLSADALIEYDSRQLLQVKRFHLASDDKEVLFSGEINMPYRRFSGILFADIPEVTSLFPAQFRESGLTGDFILRGEVEGDIGEKRYTFDPRLQLNNFSHTDPLITDFAGREIRAAAELSLKNNNDLSVTSLNVELERAGLKGEGIIDIGAGEISFSCRLNFPDLNWLTYHVDHQIIGEIVVDLQVDGAIVEPELDLSIEGKDLAANQIGPFDLTALTSASFSRGMLCGDLTGQVQGRGEEIEFGLAYFLEGKELSLQDILIAGAGVELAGDCYLMLDHWLVDGELKADFADLRRTGEFISLPLQGFVEADLSFTVDESRQDLDFSMTGRDLQTESFALAGVEIEGRSRDLHGIASFKTSMQATGGQRGDISLNDFLLEIEGVPEQIEFSADLDGYMAAPLQLSLTGSFLADAEDRELILAKLQGRFADMDYSLRETVRMVHSEERTQLSPLRLDLAGGFFSLAGERREQSIEGDLKMEGLDFARLKDVFEFPLDGELDLLMQLRGTVETPELTVSFNVDNLSRDDERLVEREKLSAHLEFELAGGFFDFATSVRDAEQTILQSEFKMPLEWTLAPFHFEIPDSASLEGMVRGELGMESLAAALLPPDQIFSGVFSLDLSLSGDLQAPRLQGIAELTDGYYENFAAGMILNNLGLRLTAEEDAVRLRELRADDGDQGELTGKGYITLSPAEGMPWELDLTMLNFRLLRHRLITADVAQGEVRLAGDDQAGEIQGTVELQRVEVAIAEPAPTEVVNLQVREVNLPRNDIEKIPEIVFEEIEVNRFFPLALDLRLKFPARVFVRGHGLDSEWQGELTVGGAIDEPYLEGQLSVIKGRMELLGRRFTLERESFVTFDGGVPIDPSFDILAFYRRRGRQIGVRVFGIASMPEIELSSDPPMPQDEILAWVLFGRSVSSLTPLQALQLANAAASLARGDAGWNLMGRARALLGVDELDIIRDDDGGIPRLGMGRYIHERVYMQVRTGLGAADEIVLVEVELTPRIILESNVGADREGGIGIFWRYDY